jgi:hypothetical protein
MGTRGDVRTAGFAAGFTPVGEVSADERSRIAFGKAGVRRDDRYAVAVNENGDILLTPLVTIPKRELLVWENELVRASLGRGLAESAAGETVELGDFTQFVDEMPGAGPDKDA